MFQLLPKPFLIVALHIGVGRPPSPIRVLGRSYPKRRVRVNKLQVLLMPPEIKLASIASDSYFEVSNVLPQLLVPLLAACLLFGIDELTAWKPKLPPCLGTLLGVSPG